MGSAWDGLCSNQGRLQVCWAYAIGNAVAHGARPEGCRVLFYLGPPSNFHCFNFFLLQDCHLWFRPVQFNRWISWSLVSTNRSHLFQHFGTPTTPRKLLSCSHPSLFPLWTAVQWLRASREGEQYWRMKMNLIFFKQNEYTKIQRQPSHTTGNATPRSQLVFHFQRTIHRILAKTNKCAWRNGQGLSNWPLSANHEFFPRRICPSFSILYYHPCIIANKSGSRTILVDVHLPARHLGGAPKPGDHRSCLDGGFPAWPKFFFSDFFFFKWAKRHKQSQETR